MQSQVNPVRYWRTIAEELAREKNSEKLIQLAKELEEALGEDVRKPTDTQTHSEKGAAA